jgi:DNA-binding transcriptional MerR regulator
VAKSPEAFRSISEAADELGVPQHVLRFWETKFAFLRPMKRAGGRRFYRPQDIAVLREVRRLLHEEGYTIKGVQKLHREQGIKRFLTGGGAKAPSAGPDYERDLFDEVRGRDLSPEARRALSEALAELQAAKDALDALLRQE